MSNDIEVSTVTGELVDMENEFGLFKNKLTELLNTPMGTEMRNRFREDGISLQSDRINDAIHAALVIQAMNGNIQAYTTIRDTMGHKPVDQVQNDVLVRIEMPKGAKELGE